MPRTHGRTARKRIPTPIRRAVYERDDWTCWYCDRRIAPATPEQERGAHAPYDIDGGVWLELDHITPLIAGGSDTQDNLRCACSPCNRSKSANTRFTDWDSRIALALQVLTNEPSGAATAQKAARILTGEAIRIKGGR